MRISTEKREARREFREYRELFFSTRDLHARLETRNIPAKDDRAARLRRMEITTVEKARKLHYARRFRPVIVR